MGSQSRPQPRLVLLLGSLAGAGTGVALAWGLDLFLKRFSTLMLVDSPDAFVHSLASLAHGLVGSARVGVMGICTVIGLIYGWRLMEMILHPFTDRRRCDCGRVI